MSRQRDIVRSVLWAGLLLLCLGGISHAQGFDFDEDDFSFDEDDFVFDEDDFSFDEDDFSFDEPEPTPPPAPTVTTPPPSAERRVTALVVPSGPLQPQAAEALTAEILEILPSLEGRSLQVRSNQGLRDEFEIMGSELAFECAFDPVCLGRYGRELGLDEILVGRAHVAASGQWEVTINRVQTSNNAIISYRFFSTDSRVNAVSDALPNQIRVLYGLRPERTRDVEESSGRWQRTVAWSTLGASAVALGLGTYFGLQASSLDDDLMSTPRLPGGDGELVYQRSQRDAQADIDKARSQAALANVMFATGAGLAAVSTVFFLVRPGSDIDFDADLVQAPGGRIGVSPSAGRGGMGVSGRFRF